MEERLKSHYESLTRVIRFVRAADTKAAPVLGLQIALVGTLAARSDRLLTIIVEEPRDVESIILVTLIVLYSFLLVAVVGFAALVYVPINPRTGESLIYFEDIAAMDYELFESRAKGNERGGDREPSPRPDSQGLKDSQRQDAPSPLGIPA